MHPGAANEAIAKSIRRRMTPLASLWVLHASVHALWIQQLLIIEAAQVACVKTSPALTPREQPLN